MKKLLIATSIAGILAAAPAFAQSTTTRPSTGAPSATAPSTSTVETENLMNMPVYSSDNKKLGTVAAVVKDSKGMVSKLDADIGGFLGIGQHRIELTPAQYTVGSDRIMLSLTADQAKALPEVPSK